MRPSKPISTLAIINNKMRLAEAKLQEVPQFRRELPRGSFQQAYITRDIAGRGLLRELCCSNEMATSKQW